MIKNDNPFKNLDIINKIKDQVKNRNGDDGALAYTNKTLSACKNLDNLAKILYESSGLVHGVDFKIYPTHLKSEPGYLTTLEAGFKNKQSKKKLVLFYFLPLLLIVAGIG